MPVVVRLCEQDRELYGGDDGPLPAELRFDAEQLKDMIAADLIALEIQMGFAVAILLPMVEPQMSKAATVRRAVAFIAARWAGHKGTFGDFQPRLLRAEFDEEATAGPPVGPSGSSSEGAE